MLNTLLYVVFFIVLFLVWQHMRNSALTNLSWRALLSAYQTMETPKTLSGSYLNIVICYFDELYMKRIYIFYETPKGLLITLSRQFFSKSHVLIPWEDIEPAELHNRGIATMQRLKIARALPAKIDITRADFIQYIRKHVIQ